MNLGIMTFNSNRVSKSMMHENQKLLSKSKYLKGRQCPLRLWLAAREKEPLIEAEEIWEMRSIEGREVEEVVATLLQDPIRIIEAPEDDENPQIDNESRLDLLLKATSEALSQSKPILQACLAINGLLAIVDVLEPRENGWYLWEIKASTKMSPLHVFDLAFQVEVAKRFGLQIAGAGLWLLNQEYVLERELCARKLVGSYDLTSKVNEVLAETSHEIDEQLAILNQSVQPNKIPGPFCKANRKSPLGNRPSTCGHLSRNGHCGSRLPEYWIGEIPEIGRVNLGDWDQIGLTSIDQLDDQEVGHNFSDLQHRVIQCTKKRVCWIDKNVLSQELARLQWPLAFIDFEFDTGMAVPRFQGTWPYARIPFQWSMLIQEHEDDEDGRTEDFLWLEASDPSKEFLSTLIEALPPSGSIVCHYKSAESTVLGQLAKRLGTPYSESVAEIRSRLFDTCDLLRRGYYHYDQHGSYSIKKVAPVLLGKSYDHLAIQDGMTAVAKWKYATSDATSAEEKAKIGGHLKSYCQQDTMLMCEIIRKIRDLIA